MVHKQLTSTIGHYVSFFRSKLDHKQWFYANDSQVSVHAYSVQHNHKFIFMLVYKTILPPGFTCECSYSPHARSSHSFLYIRRRCIIYTGYITFRVYIHRVIHTAGCQRTLSLPECQSLLGFNWLNDEVSYIYFDSMYIDQN